ncbi:MAG: hypothetical protein IIU74_08070, partial [Ruminiclostridium sp.]|nr:hypothetical protein [Ruminiclostridium sp.]
MKKWLLILVLCLGLTACNEQDLPLEETVEFIAPPGAATMTCRVMEEEEGTLLLAKVDGGKADLFTTSCKDVQVKYQDPARTEIQAGDLVVIGFDQPDHAEGILSYQKLIQEGMELDKSGFLAQTWDPNGLKLLVYTS